MMSKNLRSVVAQVARGRKSVSSRPNFSTNSNPTTETNDAGGNVLAAALNRSIETASKMRLGAATYLVLGYCGFATWEIVRLGEYRRTCERVLEEDQSQREEAKLMRLWLAKL